MGNRLELHEQLCTLLGARNVYFQPPNGLQMTYPCIVYDRTKIRTQFASGRPYLHQKQYTVTAIGQDPDSALPDRIAEMPTCKHDRAFKADNLYHDVFTIYF